MFFLLANGYFEIANMIVWLNEAAGFHLQQLAMSKRTSHTKGDKGDDQRDLHTDDENK